MYAEEATVRKEEIRKMGRKGKRKIGDAQSRRKPEFQPASAPSRGPTSAPMKTPMKAPVPTWVYVCCIEPFKHSPQKLPQKLFPEDYLNVP